LLRRLGLMLPSSSVFDSAQKEWFKGTGCNVCGADVYAIQTVHSRKMRVNQDQARNAQIGMFRRFTRFLYDFRVLRSERNAYRSFNARGRVGFLPVSQGTEQELRSSHGVEQGLVEVIPNGADLERFHPRWKQSHREAIRREIGCGDHAIVFLFAGGEWNRKGLRLALESLATAKHADRTLIVAGDDSERNRYRTLADELGVSKRVHWLGFRNDIERIYAASDVFLFPSAYEAFSLATIEAAATGLPVIMCDICGATELLGEESCGFIVDRNPGAIAAVLDMLASSPLQRMEMGQRGRERVERLFNWDRIADQTLGHYQQLLGQRLTDLRRAH
jgi:glycosyltransferase involved in cell wall biosynthesis